MEIEETSVESLKPYPGNPRRNEKAVAKVAASLREFGFRQPIVVDEKMVVIAGHTRLAAAKVLGLTTVPVHIARGLSPAKVRAYRLADNRTNEEAEWDFDKLRAELEGLKLDGVDLSSTGFDEDEIARALAEGGEGLTDPDDVPEAPARAVTVLGDTWLLGKHRLRCGDSTSATDVKALLSGQSADLCFTSPPYAKQRDYKKEIGDWDSLMNGVFSVLPVKSGAHILVNLGLVHDAGKVNTYWGAWLDFMNEAGWPLFGWYVWDKGFGLPGNWNGRLAPAHEFIFHFSKGENKSANKWVDKKPGSIKPNRTTVRRADGTMTPTSNPAAGLQPTKVADSVIRITPQMNNKLNHPAVFPVALCEHIYRSYAKAGDWMYEPFSGSGTSIIACENMGMHCAAMELAPEYVDVAIKRWQDFTGQAAVLESSGQPFAEVAESRYDFRKDGFESYELWCASKRGALQAAE